MANMNKVEKSEQKKISTPSDNSPPSSKGKAKAVKKGQLDNVAVSLRRAYDDAVNEAVPDAMMDLLRRLG